MIGWVGNQLNGYVRFLARGVATNFTNSHECERVALSCHVWLSGAFK